MKQGIHPSYGLVVFRDRRAGKSVLIRSAVLGRRVEDHPPVVWVDGGETYPVADADVTSASCPCWTGRGPIFDREGHVETVNRRYGTSR